MYMPPNEGGDFTPPPEGNHPARCYRVVDLGTQKGAYNGQETFKRKILLSWELPTELMEDGQPFTAHSRYTFSSHQNAIFRQQLESWRGKAFEDKDFGPGGFDVKKLLGVPCLLGIVHDDTSGRLYANVTSVVRLPKGMDVPQLTNAPALLSLDRGEFDQAVFDALSDGLKDTIRKSPEYAEVIGGMTRPNLPPVDGVDLDDSIPF